MVTFLPTVSRKRAFASAHDVVMAGIAMILALTARYGLDDLPTDGRLLLWIGGFMAISAVAFRIFGLGRGMWRFASITDLRAIVFASTLATLAFLVVMFALTRLDGLPRTAPIIAWFVLIVLLGAPRLAYRAFKDGGITGIRPRDLADRPVQQVLIVGGASDADKVIRNHDLERSRRLKVHGIIDHSGNKRGRDVRGVPIIGTIDELDAIVARLSRGGVTINALILASPREDRHAIQPLAASAARLGLPLRRVSSESLTESEPNVENVTLEDLLGRAPVKLELDNIRALISDQVVLVTGAGGSIGSEIVRQVAALGPSRMVLIDNSEFALYEIDQCLDRDFAVIDRIAAIADVRDEARIRAIMLQERPSVVFHAAALKHVPLVESNVCEGVLTNVIGARNVALAAVDAGVDTVVVISTDKAIRPTSVMGATKRAAEAFCQALDVSGVRTRFITVRFGNVLGSNGSVVPLFKRQILAGGPVTITHPDMKRYFMTIKEATELVLQAAANAVARNDERGRIFVLDMGQPVRIVDLARTMIALAGLRPDVDIPISYSGLRPGEKLFEELFDKDEATIPSGADGVFMASARLGEYAALSSLIERLAHVAGSGDATAARSVLGELVPEMMVAHEEPAAPGSTPGNVVLLKTAAERSLAARKPG
jgi:O-antigen biosynthesis protein WbqV